MSIIEATAVSSDPRQLTGMEKAAIVLLELGTERAAQILKLLPEHEVAEISAVIARSDSIKADDAERSMREFAALIRTGHTPTLGGLGRARDLLEASMGSDRAEAILGGVIADSAPSPFEFLGSVEPRQVLNFLANEHPQAVAVIIAHMSVDAGTAIMNGLAEDMRKDVAIRLARLERISAHVVHEVVEVLQRRFGSGLTERRELDSTDGMQRLIDILNRTDRGVEKTIFEALEEAESELADTVRSLMFVFEDLLDLDDRSVQMVLRNVDNAQLATALKGVKPEVRDKITTNMSERAAQNLIDEIDMLGQVRRSDVQVAQAAVVQVVRNLEESGDLILSRGGEEFVE